MAKRRYGKRSTKRKVSRKRMRAPKLKYDSAIAVKFTIDKPIVTDALGQGQADMLVGWGNQIDAPAADIIALRDSDEWLRYANLYGRFQVVGVKMVYKPYLFTRGSQNITVEELRVGSGTTTAVTRANMRLAIDYYAGSSQRIYSKYVGVAKWKVRNGNPPARWISTNDTTNPYSPGATLFHCQFAGLANGSGVGTLVATYYMKFKAQRLDT